MAELLLDLLDEQMGLERKAQSIQDEENWARKELEDAPMVEEGDLTQIWRH